MKYKYAQALAFAVLAGATIVTTGCSVIRGQEGVGLDPVPGEETLG